MTTEAVAFRSSKIEGALLSEGISAEMSEITTAALTALFGVIVLVTGQILNKFFIAPLQAQRKVVADIVFSHLYYGNVSGGHPDAYGPSTEELNDARYTLRRLAGELNSTTAAIPLYRLFALMKAVPQKADIGKASNALVGWSNSLESDAGRLRAEYRQSIAAALKIELY